MAEDIDMLSPSGDYKAMQPFWLKVATLMDGVDAMRAVKAYLPQFPNETDANYDYRRKNSKFTNIYRDIVENLASKPFSKEVALTQGTYPPAITSMVEDVDGAGNHLHVFAADVFFNGINNAIDWILVDFVKTQQGQTLADERRSGARPFWVRIPAIEMLAVYSAMIDGKEQFVYARMAESATERDEMGETSLQRVRVLVRDPIIDEESGRVTGYAPARFEVWELRKSQGKDSGVWTKIDEGPLSIGVIPLVPFATGRRLGGSWRMLPPLRDVADLQIEHYQQETNLKNAKELTAFPMFKGEGVSPPVNADGTPMVMPIGPSSVLFAPMNEHTGTHGSWGIIEISATSLEFLARQIAETEKQMREIGRQPLTAGTSGITQVAAAFASQKASSAIQAWAFLLKDALEQAFKFSAMWLGTQIEPTVYVNTDFAIELGAEKAPDTLLSMHERKVLSTKTLWQEMKRRSILSPEFDEEREEDRIIEELPGEDDEEDLRAAMTPPITELVEEDAV